MQSSNTSIERPSLHPTLRRRVHFILEVDRFGDRMSRFVDKALVFLIVANVVVAILQTVESYKTAAPWFFDSFEAVSMTIFGLEYALRVWSCVEDKKFADVSRLRARLRFMVEPMMLLDLAVLVLPVYFDLRPLRVLRLLRLGRYSPRLRLFAHVIKAKREELTIGLFIAVVLLVACSTAMYHVEKDSSGTSFTSIPETMWWGVATLTTVGYGDVYPTTDLGKALGSIVALLGVGIFALPAGILASGFAEALSGKGLADGVVKAVSDDSQAHAVPRGGNGAEFEHPDHDVPAEQGGLDGTCPHCGASLTSSADGPHGR